MARSSFSLNPKKGPSLSVAFQASQIKKVSMYGLNGDNKLNSGIHDFDSFLNIPNPNKREQILIGGEGTKQMKANVDQLSDDFDMIEIDKSQSLHIRETRQSKFQTE